MNMLSDSNNSNGELIDTRKKILEIIILNQ